MFAEASSLDKALAGFAAPGDAVPADPLACFVALFDAIRPRGREPASAAVTRYAALVQRVESDPATAAAVRRALWTLLTTRRLVSFFADSGILPATGFFSELGRIVAHRLLPELPDEGDLRDCLRRVFHHPHDWEWLGEVPAEMTLRFWRALAAPVLEGEVREPRLASVLDQMVEALLLVAYRVGGIGIEQELARLGPEFIDYAACFRGVAAEAQHFADAFRARAAGRATAVEDEKQLLVLVQQCDDVLERARRAALRLGTTLRLTYLMRRTTQSLQRVEALARLLGLRLQGDDKAAGSALAEWTTLTRAALRAENRHNSVRDHVARGVSMLALRVTDNAAKTGEHYIAASRREYFGMWRAALGAGVLIAAMALLKIFASKLDLALAGYALFYSLIYGVGFVVIYMLHLTIATKQPAMTAQTIAGYLGEARDGRVSDLERIVDLLVTVARSQFAAIMGNVSMAFPIAIAIGFGLSALLGEPAVDSGKADHLLHDLDPLGWAIPHAAIAGVFLFLSGVISGYFDNQASYARIGERVERLRWLVALAGTTRAAKAGGYVEEHLGGLAGNFLFGCMLGTAGTVGIIFGLPIDIRHIAFASANLGYALVAYEFALPLAAFAWAALGVALIGLTNLAVSFALALWMAQRARGIVFRQWGELLSRLWWRFRISPSVFFVAPRDA